MTPERKQTRKTRDANLEDVFAVHVTEALESRLKVVDRLQKNKHKLKKISDKNI